MTATTCAECATTFAPTRAWSLFCRPACKQAHHRRQAKRGHMLAILAQVARRGGDGKRTPTEISSWARTQECRLLDRWNAEDRAAGRRLDVVVAARMASGWDAVDV